MAKRIQYTVIGDIAVQVTETKRNDRSPYLIKAIRFNEDTGEAIKDMETREVKYFDEALSVAGEFIQKAIDGDYSY